MIIVAIFVVDSSAVTVSAAAFAQGRTARLRAVCRGRCRRPFVVVVVIGSSLRTGG